MISAWWLALIIPVCVMGGYMLCGLMSIGSIADKCSNCLYNKEKSN